MRLEAGLRARGARILGETLPRVANTTCAVWDAFRGETLVQALDLHGVCVSSGAACASGSLEPSPVLLAMGDPAPEGAVRFSLGPHTPTEAPEEALRALDAALNGLKDSLW